VQAVLAALDHPEAAGAFNVTPEGVLPLSTARLLFGSLRCPVPHPLAYAIYEAAWELGVGLFPGIHAHYFRYLCVADNRKARKVLGFAPRKTTLEVMLETARARRGGTGILDFDGSRKRRACGVPLPAAGEASRASCGDRGIRDRGADAAASHAGSEPEAGVAS